METKKLKERGTDLHPQHRHDWTKLLLFIIAMWLVTAVLIVAILKLVEAGIIE